MSTIVGPWTCDSCRKPISSLEDGWLEWLTAPDGRSRGLRLVHHMEIGLPLGYRCSYDDLRERAKSGSELMDLPLSEFLGPDGLMDLICMMKNTHFTFSEIEEMTKRLHIPGYEEARHHFAQAIAEDYLMPPSTPGQFFLQDIGAVGDYLREHPDRAVISQEQVGGLVTSASPRPPRMDAWFKDNGPNANPRYSGEAINRHGWGIAGMFKKQPQG